MATNLRLSGQLRTECTNEIRAHTNVLLDTGVKKQSIGNTESKVIITRTPVAIKMFMKASSRLPTEPSTEVP